ncbi:HET-domain-containing protein, partial [Glonium stellatum]
MPNQSTGSEASFEIARFWLKECVERHPNCPKPAANGFLPTRVIDVGTEGKPEALLCETKRATIPESQRQFVALSHCWGTAQILTTTSQNLHERLACIPLSLLPPVFRDAVIATRKMGIRYLWIDSLCILQDSHSDWQAESVQMCEVYHSAILTISSSHSPDAQGGLFVDRDGAADLPFEVELDLPPETMRAFEGFRLFPTPVRDEIYDSRDIPLETRAWTFQELVLAPRILKYEATSMRWECLTIHGSERHPYGGGSRHSDTIKELQSLISRSLDNETDAFDIFGDAKAIQSIHWLIVVREYTARNLTKQTDRLVAIAGIADRLQQRTKSRYVAGLWTNQMPFQLLWYISTLINPDNGIDLSRAQLPDRPKDQISPSWSWAA